MTYFPAFINVSDRTCLVVGGGGKALKKARLLINAGARLDIAAAFVSPDMTAELADLVAEGRVRYVDQATAAADLAPADLAHYELIIVATEERSHDEAYARAARQANRPVNVVDRPDLSTFITPAIVTRGDVVIGISTNGASPVLARLIRTRIESVLPARLGHLVAFCARFRRAVKAKLGAHARRAFWEQVIGGPVGAHILAGRNQAAHKQMLEALNRQTPPDTTGMVHIVGTGPGDPDLLTLRALHVMQQADVVLYDKLVGPGILDYVRRDADRIYVGKSRSNHFRTQTEINHLLLHHAKAGRRVVRLKGGDPYIFGRGGEEIDFLRDHHIATEVVPGVTAATGCAAAAKIPLTHRNIAQAVTFVTGHGENGEPDIDWRHLAQLDHTLVVYMGIARAGQISQQLMDHGMAASTPVAVVENGTLEQQKVIAGQLHELGALIAERQVNGPAVLIIGEVAAYANKDNVAELAELNDRRIA